MNTSNVRSTDQKLDQQIKSQNKRSKDRSTYQKLDQQIKSQINRSKVRATEKCQINKLNVG